MRLKTSALRSATSTRFYVYTLKIYSNSIAKATASAAEALRYATDEGDADREERCGAGLRYEDAPARIDDDRAVTSRLTETMCEDSFEKTVSSTQSL